MFLFSLSFFTKKKYYLFIFFKLRDFFRIIFEKVFIFVQTFMFQEQLRLKQFQFYLKNTGKPQRSYTKIICR